MIRTQKYQPKFIRKIITLNNYNLVKGRCHTIMKPYERDPINQLSQFLLLSNH